MPGAGQSRDTERVPVRCTCGAWPPEDARFCHKCGRPLYDAPEPEVASPPAPPPPPLVAPPIEQSAVNLQNRAAVRAGLMAAVASSLLLLVPMPLYVNIVWSLAVLLAGGFLSVWLYRRRTGREVSGRNGAWLGWITGLFCFVFAAVLMTVTILAISGESDAAAAFRDQLEAQATGGVDPQEVLDLVLSPAGVVLILVFTFFVCTLLATLGGVMGAKVLEKE